MSSAVHPFPRRSSKYSSCVISLSPTREREVASDSGYQQSLELWLPPNRSGIDFFAFTDAGYGLREDTLPGEDQSLTLMSYGLGARWRPNRHFNLALDFARVIAGEGGVQGGDMRLHFNVLVRN